MISRGQMYRQLYQQGGEIMPRLNQLGSNVSLAEQTLQQIKQRLQSAESTLGEGGGNTAPIGSGFMQPVSMNNSQAPDLRAIPEFMKDPSYQPIQIQQLGLGMLDKIDPPTFMRPGNIPGTDVPFSTLRGGSQFSQVNPPQTLQPAVSGLAGIYQSRQSYMGGGQGITSLDAGAPSIKYTGIIDPNKPTGPLAPFYEYFDMEKPKPKPEPEETLLKEGIMQMVPREEAFLGGLKSAVKKVTGAVKDVVSSDIGKAALLAAAGSYGLGVGPLSGIKGAGFLKGIGLPSIAGKDILSKGATLLAGSALMTKLFGSPTEAAQMYSQRPEAVTSYLRDYYRQVNPKQEGQSDEEYEQQVADFVTRNTAEYRTSDTFAYGGRAKYAMGNTAQMAAGIEGLPFRQNQAGVGEVDMRETGGFIPPVGVKEKADDIPAMLSNNEFVFTADAVRGMGDGDVNIGAQRMYDMMKKLENGGRV